MDLNELPPISSPLPWHARKWAHFKEQLALDQFPHAMLLVGEQYTGKSQLALALSRLLLCSQAGTSLNCGHCHACALSASGGHGDFRWVEPGDKSRVIKIEQIRDLVRFTNKTAGFGLRKVIVLAPADSMNVNAFNALLKSLEEPAKETYLILVCHRLHGIPATIRSRCQIVRLETPHTDVSLDWLDMLTGKREQSQQLLTLAYGLPLLAKQLYSIGEGEMAEARRLGIHALLKGKITALEAFTLWREEDVGTFLEQLAAELQRLSGPVSLEWLRSISGRNTFRVLDEVSRLQQVVVAGANPSKQLLAEALLSKLHRDLGAGPLTDNIYTQAGEARI